MELIATLIRLALIECFKRGIITWQPGQDEPESFEAECTIEFNPYQVGPFDDIEFGLGYTSADWFIELCGVFTIVDAEHLDTWHSSLIECV